MAQIVKVEVEINNSKQVKPFSQVMINQSMDWHHTFQVRCPVKVLENVQKAMGHVGEPIKISIKSELNKQSKEFFFKGIITKVSLLKYKGTDGDILIQGFSPTILLDDGPNCASFEKLKISDIASKICSAYASNLLSSKVKTIANDTHPYLFQYKESNYRFLKRLAQTYGEWFFYDGSDIIFGEMKANKSTTMYFGSDLTDFDLTMSVTPSTFSQVNHDYVSNKIYKSKTSKNVSGLDSNGQKALKASCDLFSAVPVTPGSVTTLDNNQLGNLVLAQQSGIAGDMMILEGSSDNQEVRIGTEIEVSGKNESFGKYIIIEARHSSDGLGNYQNHFKAVPSSLKLSPGFGQRITPPVIETQNAQVVDNNDPDGFGRVKVHFPWQADGGKSPWIRVMSSSSGKERGFYWIPEINDDVLVSFEDGNIDKPFVMGTVFQKDTQPKEWKNDKNFLKGLKTKSGNEILFNDEDSKETIKIKQKDSKNEIVITMEGDGKISLTTKGDMIFKAQKSITIEAGEEIKMKSTKGTTLNASEVKINAQQTIEAKGLDIKLAANASLEAKATTELKLEGLTTSLKASTKGEIKASAMLDLDGGGMASLKGALVKIN